MTPHNRGQASAALELTEYAIAAIEKSSSQVRDDYGDVVQVLQNLEELHLIACKKVRPEPRALAKRLFEAEMQSDAELFQGSALRYRDVLGVEGLDEYSKLARSVWETFPALKPGDRAVGHGQRDRVKQIMEALADGARDLDAWIEIQSRDLSTPFDFLQVGERLMRADQHERAMDWVQRGLNAFPGERDPRLRALLAALHHHAGQHDFATEALWTCFTDAPGQSSYEQLLKSAATHGAKTQWRERAQAHIRDILRSPCENLQKGGSARWDHALKNEWVRILVAEGEFESAWREGCIHEAATGLMIELAKDREHEHPQDVIPIYRRYVRELIDQRDNQSYAAAVNYLLHLRDLAARTLTEEEFAGYLLGLKQEHRAKINLMKKLKAAHFVVENRATGNA